MTTPLAALIDRVQRLTGRVDSTYRSRALDAIDDAVQWYSQRAPWNGLKELETFATPGGQRMALPDRIAQIISVSDLTNKRWIEPGEFFENKYTSPYLDQQQSTAFEWRPLGNSPVLSQPDAARYYTVQASVSEAMTVTLKGLVHDSGFSGTPLSLYEAIETFTLGSAAVTSTNQYFKVLGLQKNKGTTGSLVLTQLTENRKVARVEPWDESSNYKVIEFMYAPATNTQMRINYYRKPDRLTSESDILDPDIDEAIIRWYAAGTMLAADEALEAGMALWSKAEKRLNEKMNADKTFGERDSSPNMWQGYRGLEDMDADGYGY